MNKKNKGFTLIELLVVIAIIGMLAAIILASLSTARSKGANAAIKGDLANMRAQAELDYSNFGSYAYWPSGAGPAAAQAGGTCPGTIAAATANSLFTDPTIFAAYNGAVNTAGSGATSWCYSNVTPGATPVQWSMAVQLAAKEGTAAQNYDYWCVDSSGKSEDSAALPTTALGSMCP